MNPNTIEFLSFHELLSCTTNDDNHEYNPANCLNRILQGFPVASFCIHDSTIVKDGHILNALITAFQCDSNVYFDINKLEFVLMFDTDLITKDHIHTVAFLSNWSMIEQLMPLVNNTQKYNSIYDICKTVSDTLYSAMFIVYRIHNQEDVEIFVNY